MKTNTKSIMAFSSTVIFILLVVWIGSLTGNSRFLFITWYPQCRWIAIMVLMALFLALIGWVIKGDLKGVLIDSRNKMSLSRFQVAIWTIVIMSAFFTMGLARARNDGIEKLTIDNIGKYKKLVKAVKLDCIDDNPDNDEKIIENCTNPQALDIYFPEEILLVMGISLASFAGASLIKSKKRFSEISQKEDFKTLIEAKKDEINKVKNDKAEELKKLNSGEIVIVTEDKLDEFKNQVKELENELKNLKDELDELVEESKKETELKEIKDKIEKKEKQLDKAKYEYIKAQVDYKNTEKMLKEYEEKKRKGDERLTQLNAELDEIKKKEQSRIDRDGILHKNYEPKDASWADLFRGEEIIDFHTIDMAKVQMFFISVTIVFTYAVGLLHLFQDTNILNNPFGILLPGLSANVIALLGISHGGYLAVKAPKSTKTEK